MEWKPKYNKNKCAKCKYHGVGCGGKAVKIGKNKVPIFCDYGLIANKSPLQPTSDGQGVIDLRGGDYNNCLLFEKGKRINNGNISI